MNSHGVVAVVDVVVEDVGDDVDVVVEDGGDAVVDEYEAIIINASQDIIQSRDLFRKTNFIGGNSLKPVAKYSDGRIDLT
jgi:hypothetical protein